MPLRRFMLPLFISLSGFIYCLASIFGVTETICHTTGCQVYKGYSFLGFSFYTWGALAFALCAFFLIFRKKLNQFFSFDIYSFFLTFCLLGEVGLLAYQAIYLPCFSCLVVGLLWGILFILDLKWKREDNFDSKKILVGIWGLLFFTVATSAIKDIITPWPIYGKPDAPIKIFFSPTCPACKKAVQEILEKGLIDKNKIALFPVAKNEEDKNRICLLQCSLRGDNKNKDLPLALNRCWQPECTPISVGLWDKLRLNFNLFRNRLALVKMGINHIPVIISRRPLLVKTNTFPYSFFNTDTKDKSNYCSITGRGCQN